MTDSSTLDTELDVYNRRAARQGRRKPSAAEVASYTAAAGGLAFAGGDALGAIVHNSTGTTLSVSNTSDFFAIDIDGDGGNDWGLYLFADSIYASASHERLGLGATVATGATSGRDAIKLNSGFVVGPTLASGVFNTLRAQWYLFSTFGGDFGPFYNGTTGYLGLRFDGDTGIVGTQYAWVKVRFDQALPSLTMTVQEWAYDDCGDAIAVGATDGGRNCSTNVPTPATPLLTLLGLGAMGVQAYRRRREEGLKRLAEEQA